MIPKTSFKQLLRRWIRAGGRSQRRRQGRSRSWQWSEALEDRCLLSGIQSILPSSAVPGTTDLQVTFTLDANATPPLPPSQVNPESAWVGAIVGSDVTRDGLEVTARFDIPVDEAIGTKDVAVYFQSPTGLLAYTLPDGFSVLESGLPLVTIAATDGQASEAGNDTGTFTITRTGSTEGDLTVQLSVGGSATEGADFQQFAAVATILDGQSSVALTLTPVDDAADEPTETVTLTVSADAAYTVGASNSATVNIADDDGAGVTAEVSYAIVDTGQTAFYNNTTEITAPAEGDAFYGQDAQFIGNAPSYTVSGDGLTVYDNVTELTWTQGADWSGDGSVDADDKFTYAEALAYVDTLNAQNYGGFNDWRLPSIKELYSLIDYRGTDPNPTGTSTAGLVPFINDDVFEFAYGDMSSGERIIDSQWATTTLYVSTVMDNQAAMFGVNFADGRIKGYPAGSGSGGISKTFYVRFCRGNTDYGENSFTDNGDGTVTDSATGLMWSQDDNGEGVNWEDALAWVEQMNDENYLGHDDWRLPNAKELQSLVDYTRSPDTTNSAAIDSVFNATQITDEAGEEDYAFYWSGTTFLRFDGSASAAVYISFGEGLGSMDGTTVIDVHGAGCQRSDPKDGTPNDYPTWGFGPQGDVQRVFNYVRLVRDANEGSESDLTALDTAALYNPGHSVFYLKNSHEGGMADTVCGYGPAGANWIPLAGDWDGDGIDSLGLYDSTGSVFFLRNSNSAGTADVVYGFGPAGSNWQPIVGDWDGDGVDTLGLYNSTDSTFYLQNSHVGGVADLVYGYGPAGSNWQPIAGDWDGDGVDTLGLYESSGSTFFLQNSHVGGIGDLVYGYGPAGSNWQPIAGDWDGDGVDTLGLFDQAESAFYLRNSHAGGEADVMYSYGPAGSNWQPITGDWTGLAAIRLNAPLPETPIATESLTQDDLEPIIETAIALWGDTGISVSELLRLNEVTVSVADLSGSYLAVTSSNTIVIDINAAGYGWYVEGQNSESGIQNPEVAESCVDLLTVVAHEFGHVLGLGHDFDDDVMEALLPVGVRRLPGPDEIDAAFSADWSDFLVE